MQTPVHHQEQASGETWRARQQIQALLRTYLARYDGSVKAVLRQAWAACMQMSFQAASLISAHQLIALKH